MRSVFYLIVFVCFALTGIGQIGAGYMDKRCAIGYGFYTSPAIVNSNASGMALTGGISKTGNAETGDLAFNVLHEGFLEFAIKNRTSIGASCRFFKTTYDNRETMLAYYISTDPYTGYPEQEYQYDARPTGLYDITGFNYMLYFKFFRKGYLAPWGKYFMVGPVYSVINTSYDPTVVKVKGLGGTVDLGPKENSFAKIDIVCGFGRSRVLFDRVLLEYGINLGLFGILTTPGEVSDEFLFEEVGWDEITNNNYIERTSRRRVRSINRFNAFLKIGFLLF